MNEPTNKLQLKQQSFLWGILENSGKCEMSHKNGQRNLYVASSGSREARLGLLQKARPRSSLTGGGWLRGSPEISATCSGELAP